MQAVAELIRTHSTGGSTDAALAGNLRSNMLQATLPKTLRAHGVSPEEQKEELGDALAENSGNSHSSPRQRRPELALEQRILPRK